MQSTRHVRLVDTHCHLDFRDFDDDREQVLEDAGRSGVDSVINPGIDAASSQKVVDLALRFPQVYAAVGVHPNEALTWEDETNVRLERLAKSKKVVAIGEIGLDYYRHRAPRANQVSILEQQLALASHLGLPVILHNREAEQDLLSILKDWQLANKEAGSGLADRPGVLHSFSASAETAYEAIDMNFYLGITGPVTYPNAKGLQQVVRDIPLERLLVETDAPFLAPQPRRGKRNEPAFVTFIAEKIADLKGLKFEEVARQTTANARLLFQIGEKSLA